MDRANPVVMRKMAAMKVKPNRPCADQGHTRTKDHWGVKNYLPEREMEDDDVSIDRFVRFLIDESRKNPNKVDMERVRDRMGRTFADRRKMVVTDCATVAIIKNAFPFLFREEEVRQYNIYSK